MYGDTSNNCTGDTRLLIDIPRGTLMRLADLKMPPQSVQIGFFTHFHADHMSELYDLLYIRALVPPPSPPPFPVVSPTGNITFTINNVELPWQPDTENRKAFLPSFNPAFTLTTFDPTLDLQPVWSSHSGNVNLWSTLVNHSMPNAVGYQIRTPVVNFGYSGDGRVSDGLVKICSGVTMCSVNAYLDKPGLTFFPFFPIIHANSSEVGTMAKQINLPVLLMTHLMPPPGQGGVTEDDWRSSISNKGGFMNKLIIANDLNELKYGLMHLTSFTWINIATGEETPIVSGAVIEFHRTGSYTIRANVGDGSENINVVLFTKDGAIEHEANVSPYVIGGQHHNGVFRPWNVPEGTHVIAASAFNDGAAIFGPPISVTVTFVSV
jgi:ribonuclease BN (tRNA processing enzyme)